MQRGVLEQLVLERGARTGLVRSHQAVVQVEADAIVERQLLRQLPLVLHVAAVNPGLQPDIVHERNRDIRRLDATHCGKSRLMIVDLGALGVEISAETKRMTGDSVVSSVELKSVAPVAAENLRRGAVVDQIAGVIGIERNR